MTRWWKMINKHPLGSAIIHKILRPLQWMNWSCTDPCPILKNMQKEKRGWLGWLIYNPPLIANRTNIKLFPPGLLKMDQHFMKWWAKLAWSPVSWLRPPVHVTNLWTILKTKTWSQWTPSLAQPKTTWENYVLVVLIHFDSVFLCRNIRRLPAPWI